MIYADCNAAMSATNPTNSTTKRDARLVKMVLTFAFIMLLVYYVIGSLVTDQKVQMLEIELQAIGSELMKVTHQMNVVASASENRAAAAGPGLMGAHQVEDVVRRFTDKIHEEILQSSRDVNSLRTQLDALRSTAGEGSSTIRDVMLVRPDYARESVGGSIHSTGASVVPMGVLSYYFGVRSSNAPLRIIQPTKAIGECYGFYGSVGEIVLKLQKSIFVEAISVDHITATMAPSGVVDSAPNRFEVFGLELMGGHQHFFGSYEYMINVARTLQTFDIPISLRSTMSYQYIQFRFQSNHGNPEYTCVYQVQVHGRPDG